MEGKWIAVMVVGITIAMFAPLAVMEHGKNQCRITSVQAGVSAEDITKICK